MCRVVEVQVVDSEFPSPDALYGVLNLLNFTTRETLAPVAPRIAPRRVRHIAVLETLFLDHVEVGGLDAPRLVTHPLISSNLIVGMLYELEEYPGRVSDSAEVRRTPAHFSVPDQV